MKSYLFIFAMLIFASCKNGGESNISSVSQQRSIPKSNNISLDKYVKLHDIIALEATEKSLVLAPNAKVKVYQDLLFVYGLGQPVLCFSLASGKFLRTFGNQGAAPGEYVQATGLEVNKQFVYVLDGMSGKVIRYDHSGNVINQASNGNLLYSDDVVYFNEKIYINTPNDLNGADYYSFDEYLNKFTKHFIGKANKGGIDDPYFPYKVKGLLSSYFTKIGEHKLLLFRSVSEEIFAIDATSGNTSPVQDNNLHVIHTMPPLPKNFLQKDPQERWQYINLNPKLQQVFILHSRYIIQKFNKTDKKGYAHFSFFVYDLLRKESKNISESFFDKIIHGKTEYLTIPIFIYSDNNFLYSFDFSSLQSNSNDNPKLRRFKLQ